MRREKEIFGAIQARAAAAALARGCVVPDEVEFLGAVRHAAELLRKNKYARVESL